MAANGFKRSLDRVLVHEGGKADHPKDPGGRTNKGITQRTYDAWRKRQGKSRRDVWTIMLAEVEAIYREQYWNIIKGDDLPAGVDYVVFDAAVNSGPERAGIWLQRALGERYRSRVDGVIGTETLAAVEAHRNHDALIAEMCARRMAFLRELKTWPTFGRGWTTRVNGVLMAGQALATGQQPLPAEYVPDGEQKAEIDQAKPAPSTAPGDVAVGGGSVGAPTGGAGAEVSDRVREAQDQLSPMASFSEWVTYILIGLAVISVGLVIGGLAYRFWAKRRQQARADALDLPTRRTADA